jgi:hypothetical protein
MSMNRNAKILIVILAALTWSTAVASAHQGHSHSILGTVKEISEERMVVTTKEGKEAAILLTTDTKYSKGKAVAKRTDLTVGSRVSIQVKDDGTTAVSVKIGTAKTSG